jgi:hypothetical protein
MKRDIVRAVRSSLPAHAQQLPATPGFAQQRSLDLGMLAAASAQQHPAQPVPGLAPSAPGAPPPPLHLDAFSHSQGRRHFIDVNCMHVTYCNIFFFHE